jgi:hypothetical protein
MSRTVGKKSEYCTGTCDSDLTAILAEWSAELALRTCWEGEAEGNSRR